MFGSFGRGMSLFLAIRPLESYADRVVQHF